MNLDHLEQALAADSPLTTDTLCCVTEALYKVQWTVVSTCFRFMQGEGDLIG